MVKVGICLYGCDMKTWNGGKFLSGLAPQQGEFAVHRSKQFTFFLVHFSFIYLCIYISLLSFSLFFKMCSCLLSFCFLFMLFSYVIFLDGFKHWYFNFHLLPLSNFFPLNFYCTAFSTLHQFLTIPCTFNYFPLNYDVFTTFFSLIHTYT